MKSPTQDRDRIAPRGVRGEEDSVVRVETEPASTQVQFRDYKPLLRSFAVRFCISATLGMILLLAGEAYSYWRYLPNARDTMEPAIKLELAQGDSEEREYWSEFDAANKIKYQPYVLWRRAPFEGKLLAIDQDGIRRTTHTQCDGKTFTIWMFGDSVMWGSGAPDNLTIPSQIAADYENAGTPVCILNFGEKGWANTQEMIFLIERLKHTSRKPDVVLFYDGGTEAFTAYQSGQADVHSNFNGFRKYLDNWSVEQHAGFSYLRQTNTYRFLEKIAVHLSPTSKKEEAPIHQTDADALSQAVMQNYLRNMDLIELLASHDNFRAIFAWYPNMAVGHKLLTPYEQQVLKMEYQKFPGLDLVYKAAYERCREVRRSDLNYLGDLLDNQTASLYLGISHLKPEGNKVVADRLFQILTNAASAPEPTKSPSSMSRSRAGKSAGNPS
jgi:hypothetical protein